MLHLTCHPDNQSEKDGAGVCEVVFGNAFAVSVHEAEIVLRFGIPLLSGRRTRKPHDPSHCIREWAISARYAKQTFGMRTRARPVKPSDSRVKFFEVITEDC